MSKEVKQQIYELFRSSWNTNPSLRVLGYNNGRYCTGLASAPKDLVDILNNKETVGVVFLTSPLSYTEYDLKTGKEIVSEKFFNSYEFDSFDYKDYAQVLLSMELDLDDHDDAYKFDERLEKNGIFLDTLIDFGFASNIDVEPFAMRLERGVEFPLRTLTLSRGNLSFLLTREQLAIRVGVDGFMIVHDFSRDVEMDFIVDIMARGLLINVVEFEEVLTKALEVSQ
ncbi:hypothetical protein COF68_06135 [Bacillus toyonensis]|uniref:hypothetical protein n=1 Tax=Bacillus toyonensis TaxID=155322 RepID=UPI000BFC438E|nr:hypothetical protein [Bacillus toyonensis]PHE64413.1 hypothetical protein COF68_06135 [Bacillus toyonensis]